MIAMLRNKTLLFIFCLGFFGFAFSGDTKTEGSTTEEGLSNQGDVALGDKQAGEDRYNKTCINCHGPAGKGVASFPKVSGNEIPHTIEKLETYRAGTKVGPNSSLMIMMAKPLTDEEILNLAAYLEDASNQ